MKDAKVILEKAEKIIEKVPNATVNLETTAPVCSKSIQYLSENDVAVLKIVFDQETETRTILLSPLSSLSGLGSRVPLNK